MKKREYFEKAIKWVENKGFSDIRANYADYEAPAKYASQDKDRSFTPDITGKKRGKKSYIEIALKTDEIRKRITKWKLLAQLSALKGGKLFLLAPNGHKSFTERMLRKYNLNAQVVYLKNQ